MTYTNDSQAAMPRFFQKGMQSFGVLFCAQWLLSLVGFPFMKGRPFGLVAVAVGLLCGVSLCMADVRGYCNSLLHRPNNTQFLWSVLIVALIIRVAAVLVFPLEPLVDDAQFHRYAVNMLQGESYGSPRYRAFFPPGMSLTLYIWYSLLGPSWWAGKLLNGLFGLAFILLVFDLTRRTVSPLASRWAAVLTTVMPTLVFYTATLGYEILLGVILLAVCDLALVVRLKSMSWRATLLLGMLLGFGALVKPICVFVPVLLFLWWWSRSDLHMGLARTLMVMLFMACTIMPWTWRNYRVFGEFVFISTNSGITLYAANNEHSQGIAMPVKAVPGAVDEVTADKVLRRKALQWIMHNPSAWLRLAVNKCMYTWGTSTSIMSVVSTDRLSLTWEAACMAMLNIFWAMLLVLCTMATFKTSVWQNIFLAPLFLLLAYVFMLHLFFEAMSRHHIPVLGVLILVAAVGLAEPQAE